jgi:protease I
MADELTGKRIAFLVANSGAEQVELTTPWDAVKEAGAQPVLLAPEKGTVQAFNNDVEQGDTFDADVAVADASAADYDALVLPGGTTNPDQLRVDAAAVGFVSAFAHAGKPIAAICHAPWTLIEAEVVRGKRLTSFPSLQTDVRNAGGDWHDEESVTCSEGGFTLVTSRNPGDLDAFCAAAIEAFATG